MEARTADAKAVLRRKLKAARRAHVAQIEPRVKSLLFLRPPGPVAAMLAPGQTVGLYATGPDEAPAASYARWLREAGYRVALPWFADRGAPMRFRDWDTPWDPDTLEPGPFGIMQPAATAEEFVPDVVFVPLVGFTATGDRLGQGGGHYDRWLAAHPGTMAIGLAWDCQLVGALPCEPHDHRLRAVITPTRLYGPWDDAA
ncbi:5-formyltetrahydrofolate cyclo-ligase [Novosphingobium lentum]|uniref:5-formyltetrahydrofolate cyclo-ligase n=1 Tax=Novosphingobium lentum TaxID=145287 RepID=UPI000830EDD7|nr:5-formyltetrahydrofolate cyclo-ligase [Novosphingobium lentum]